MIVNYSSRRERLFELGDFIEKAVITSLFRDAAGITQALVGVGR